jgi:NifB/MoaA-like Fe-S oxidoreductase
LIFEAAQQSVSQVPDTISIEGNGDVSFYPDLLRLIEALSNGKVPVFLDYTSGKGFTKGDEAEPLIDAGVRRISFSIFSTNPVLRRKYVNDKHPEAVLSNQIIRRLLLSHFPASPSKVILIEQDM